MGKGARRRVTKTMVEECQFAAANTRTATNGPPMASRPLIITTLLGASIGVPYVVSRTSPGSNSGAWSPVGERPQASTANRGADGLDAVPRPQLTGPGSLLYDSPTPLEGSRFHSLAEVLRFDLPREWVYRNWARKSTGLGDPELFGVRVALVTGTGLSDLAGSLTYYFNQQGGVQHISFRGRTADTTPLVEFLVNTYKFERVEAPAGDQLYQIRRSGRVQSELRTYPEPVLWTTAPHGSIAVELELERPGSIRYLPPRTPRLEIPEVASATVRPAGSAAANASEGSAEAGGQQPALVGNVRSATPAEEVQVLWKRWPN
jgi:hypothetical protein